MCGRYSFSTSKEKLQEQFDLLLEKQSQLTVRSPVRGQVQTWDTRRRLLQRPVETGQRLLTVADSRGPWELELKLADQRSGYLRRNWNDVEKGPPKATYVLASEPTRVFEGSIREVAQRADIDEELGNVVRVYVDLENSTEVANPIADVRPGTEVIAHIHVGKASIGYCKLYEFFDWVNRTWFRYL